MKNYGTVIAGEFPMKTLLRSMLATLVLFGSNGTLTLTINSPAMLLALVVGVGLVIRRTKLN